MRLVVWLRSLLAPDVSRWPVRVATPHGFDIAKEALPAYVPMDDFYQEVNRRDVERHVAEETARMNAKRFMTERDWIRAVDSVNHRPQWGEELRGRR